MPYVTRRPRGVTIKWSQWMNQGAGLLATLGAGGGAPHGPSTGRWGLTKAQPPRHTDGNEDRGPQPAETLAGGQEAGIRREGGDGDATSSLPTASAMWAVLALSLLGLLGQMATPEASATDTDLSPFGRRGQGWFLLRPPGSATRPSSHGASTPLALCVCLPLGPHPPFLEGHQPSWVGTQPKDRILT